MRRSLYLLLIVLIVSCQSPLTDDELAWRRGIDNENWFLCARAYELARIRVTHYDHEHGRLNRVTPFNIRSDLRVNNCVTVLGPHWIEY